MTRAIRAEVDVRNQLKVQTRIDTEALSRQISEAIDAQIKKQVGQLGQLIEQRQDKEKAQRIGEFQQSQQAKRSS
ncbi:MAG: hypothetical protein KF752_17820 [Pirellulaceae bacterium]|nr:hypothetical protein [Pirellulaceae bacterium]